MFTRTGACNGTRTTKRLVGEFAQFIIVSAAAAAVICSSSQFVIPFYLSGNRFVTILLFLLSMLLNMAGTMQCGNKYQPQNLAWERTHLHWKTKDRWSAALENYERAPNTEQTNQHSLHIQFARSHISTKLFKMQLTKLVYCNCSDSAIVSVLRVCPVFALSVRIRWRKNSLEKIATMLVQSTELVCLCSYNFGTSLQIDEPNRTKSINNLYAGTSVASAQVLCPRF